MGSATSAPRFKGTLIANFAFDHASANTAIESKQAELVSFAKPFIGNLDPVRRFHEDLPFAYSSPQTYCQGKPQRYVNYAPLPEATARILKATQLTKAQR